MVKPTARPQRGQLLALSHKFSSTAASLKWQTAAKWERGFRCLLVGMLCVVTELWPPWWEPSPRAHRTKYCPLSQGPGHGLPQAASLGATSGAEDRGWGAQLVP